MGLKGVKSTNRGINPYENTSFKRSSAFIPEGLHTPILVEARVINVNLVSWTVDCVSFFDERYFFDIQIASPYLHPDRGEGIYALPEVGASCVICITSDTTAPFVLSFVTPFEELSDTSDDEQAPLGTGRNNAFSDVTFRGGRLPGKPGDIVLRGRDGNFVMLHRGGVLQVGSTQLAQRIYLPLTNLITDVSQNYNHFNTGGSIRWGLRPGSPESNPETAHQQVFRVYANDAFADIRVTIGKVHTPVPEPSGSSGSTSDLNQLGIGIDEPIVAEFVIAPGGFDSGDGSAQDVRNKTKFRMFFDRAGNGMLRAEGAVSVRVKKKVIIRTDDDIDIFCKGNLNIVAEGTARIEGKRGLDVTTGGGGALKINGGTKPTATVGSIVTVSITAPLPITLADGTPGVVAAGAVLQGLIMTGNPTVLT